MSEVPNPIDRFSAFLLITAPHFTIFGSGIQTHLLEQGSTHPNASKVRKVTCLLMKIHVCSCLNELKLNSHSQDLNPRLSTPIFSLFRLNPTISGSPFQASKFYPWQILVKLNYNCHHYSRLMYKIIIIIIIFFYDIYIYK